MKETKNIYDKIFTYSAIVLVFIYTFLMYKNNVNGFYQLGVYIENNVSCFVNDIFAINEDSAFATFKANYEMKKTKPLITLPINCDYMLKNNHLVYNNSLPKFVVAGANGVVKKIGYDNNSKYIEILHDGNIKTVYYNIDFIGVTNNNKVEKGQVISSTLPNCDFEFYLKFNDEIFTDYTISNGEIVWQN